MSDTYDTINHDDDTVECQWCRGKGRVNDHSGGVVDCQPCVGTGRLIPTRAPEVEEKGGYIGFPNGMTPGDLEEMRAVIGQHYAEERPREFVNQLLGVVEPPLLKPAVPVRMPDPGEGPKTKYGCHCPACLISNEVHRAKKLHPEWPTDPLHAFAVIAEEFGEAAKEALQLVYEPTPGGWDRLRTEVIQVAATCHRFLESLEKYEFKPSNQHRQ